MGAFVFHFIYFANSLVSRIIYSDMKFFYILQFVSVLIKTFCTGTMYLYVGL
jgi:hypothetical protein